MPPQICVGCGFEVDAFGVLQHKGARVVRQDGVTPLEWPYDGTISPEFPVADIDLTNGLGCDQSTGDLFAFPNSSSRIVSATASLIGASGGAGSGFVFSWSLDKDDFPGPNPWNDGTCPVTSFALSADAEVSLSNPSLARPMLCVYSVDVGPQVALIDEGVSLNTGFVGNIWDDPFPYPGDIALGFTVPWLGDNPTADPLAHQQVGAQHIPFYRPSGGGVLAAYLAPGATTNFRATMRGQMACGTATTRNGQVFVIGGGFNIRIIGVNV